MSIDKDKIKHTAKLARISLDEKKIDDLSKDLSNIFKFIKVADFNFFFCNLN